MPPGIRNVDAGAVTYLDVKGPALPRNLLVALAICAAACSGNIDASQEEGPGGPAGAGGSGAQPGGRAIPTPTPGGMTPSATTPAGPPPTGFTTPVDVVPVESRVWRLTRVQYDNTVRDLLGDTTAPGKGFVAESGGTGFANAEQSLIINPPLMDQFAKAAQKLAADTLASPMRLAAAFPCGADKIADDACAQRFVQEFGRRAFRRPLLGDEVSTYQALYTGSKTRMLDARTALQLVLETMLQSPHFLFRTEIGDGKANARGRVTLTPHEVAAQLSYYLWDTMPDAELSAAADSGALMTRAELDRQARRLLADGRARKTVWSFFSQMMNYDDLLEAQKTDKSFAVAKTVMPQETQRFIEELLWNDDGSLGKLLSASWTFVNKDLAAIYGLPTVTDWKKVTLEAKDRAGLLTHPALMAVTSHVEGTSPTLRGKFVAERVLCMHIPDPPPEVMVQEPKKDTAKTTRQRYQAHATSPSCAGCHRLIDAPGYAFEHLDTVGRVRRTENNIPVDTTGTLSDTTDIDGAFAHVGELAGKLAGSAQVRECMTRQLFRFAGGRLETDGDKAAIAEMVAAFGKAGFNVRELILAQVLSERFVTRMKTN